MNPAQEVITSAQDPEGAGQVAADPLQGHPVTQDTEITHATTLGAGSDEQDSIQNASDDATEVEDTIQETETQEDTTEAATTQQAAATQAGNNIQPLGNGQVANVAAAANPPAVNQQPPQPLFQPFQQNQVEVMFFPPPASIPIGKFQSPTLHV